MDKPKSRLVAIHHVGKLVSIIDRFFDTEHFSEDWVAFVFSDKPNMHRVKFLLEEIVTGNRENLSYGDKKDLFWFFSEEVVNYLFAFVNMDSMVNDNMEFRIFMLEFFRKLSALEHDVDKEGMLYAIKHSLLDTFQSPVDIKKQIEQNWLVKVKRLISNSSLKALVQIVEGNFFFVDLKEPSVLIEWGNALEKALTFSGNNVYIFRKDIPLDRNLFSRELQLFDLQHTDAKISDFLSYLKEHHGVEQIISIDGLEQAQQFFDLEVSVFLQKESMVRMLYSLLAMTQVVLKKKNIVLENTAGELSMIGLYDDVMVPNKVAHGYYGKDAITFTVRQWDKEQQLVLTWSGADSFDID
jgi:hypothetical protein